MIQRIQTIWLLLGIIVLAANFYFPIYKFDNQRVLSLGKDYIGILLTSVPILLNFVAIFSFKNRKAQKKWIIFSVLLTIALQTWFFYRISNASSSSENGYYWIGIFLPLIVVLLSILALKGIRKDEKLIKSLDRLR